MKIGLWSDCHNFPSLPLMKLSAYHKQRGDSVELLDHIQLYDLVYASKVFSFTEDIESRAIVYADEIKRGGTGYCITVNSGKEIFDNSKNQPLPDEVEHIYPDYSLYPDYKYAVGFLTRGCPRGCGFCVVGKKEGLCSRQVADLSEFWRGQKEIKLLDPNLLACKNHEQILKQLADSKASVDFTQGIDIRLVNPDNIALLNNIKTKVIHFAWDNPKQDLTDYFKLFANHTNIKSDSNKSVYVLTNYNSTIDEDLYRIYTLRDLGFLPYVMIYQKETADKKHRDLQRWCNCRWIFRSCPRFEDYKQR
ncbi:MAG: radical SAM protein [Ruminococcus sp.]